MLPKLQEFEVRVMVDNVEHLGGFGAIITYDPKKVRPVYASAVGAGGTPAESTPVNAAVKSTGVGELLASNGRQNDLLCDASSGGKSTVNMVCALLGPPVCLGGAPGASGSGLLGTVYFEGIAGGTTKLSLDSSGTQLALDDYAPPCNPDTSEVPKIPHRLGNDLSIEFESGGGSALLIIVVVVVVAVVAAGGAGGYVWYRRRSLGGSSPRSG